MMGMGLLKTLCGPNLRFGPMKLTRHHSRHCQNPELPKRERERVISSCISLNLSKFHPKMGNRKTQCPFNTINPSVIVRNSILLFLLLSPTVFAKSRRPITEIETRQRKNNCYSDIESGMWGQQCQSSMIAKENCALRCLSPACYEIVYESDPLEEGEKDLVRGQEFKYCMHKLSMGESLEDIKGSFEY